MTFIRGRYFKLQLFIGAPRIAIIDQILSYEQHLLTIAGKVDVFVSPAPKCADKSPGRLIATLRICYSVYRLSAYRYAWCIPGASLRGALSTGRNFSNFPTMSLFDECISTKRTCINCLSVHDVMKWHRKSRSSFPLQRGTLIERYFMFRTKWQTSLRCSFPEETLFGKQRLLVRELRVAKLFSNTKK